jgi:plastocyanin
MKPMYIVIVVVGLIIVGGGALLLRPNKTTQKATQTVSTASTQAETKTVTYTDSGYSPASITIKVGDSVTFKNQSSSDVRTASNPHPIHTGLKGFDAGRGYAPGEDYTFTFTKVGTFGYHNHLNPSDGGTIIVQ